ncbi:hypothetical protein HMPREF9010_00778 [Bacteroides sp. 3_1_23]|nr:hypothetical protein HMPREF9010_00778 [Bacteroides sp. 3_1_23]
MFCTFGINLCKYSNYIKNEELRGKNFWKWGKGDVVRLRQAGRRKDYAYS